jgi:DNA repair protein SbcD/Mre11
MRRLEQARIRVYIILGNHDAENRFASRLELAPNVHLFSHRVPGSMRIEGLEVVVHGCSFPQRDVTENLAQGYPAPVSGLFNIGMLHTACTGREGHALYAPCTVEQLVNHGYDYWALGHVHAYEVVNLNPHVIYPGNLQGRNSIETGPKGASLVTVEDGRVVGLEPRVLDVIRWSMALIDLEACSDMLSLHAVVRAQIEQLKDAAEGRGMALRLRFSGATALHNEIVVHGPRLREEIETIAATVSDEIWIEKIELATLLPHRPQTTDPTIAGRIPSVIEEFSKDPAFIEMIEKKVSEIREKIPVAEHADELFSAIRDEVPGKQNGSTSRARWKRSVPRRTRDRKGEALRHVTGSISWPRWPVYASSQIGRAALEKPLRHDNRCNITITLTLCSRSQDVLNRLSVESSKTRAQPESFSFKEMS